MGLVENVKCNEERDNALDADVPPTDLLCLAGGRVRLDFVFEDGNAHS